MSASVSPTKTVMDVELGNGQWRQYTTNVLPVRKPGTVLTDTVTSLLEVAAEDLRLDELEVGFVGLYVDRFPLIPGYQIHTCTPLQRLPYPERVVDFLHRLARFWQEEQPHNSFFTFDYELPPQEYQDSEVLKALKSAFQDWCAQFDIALHSFQTVNGTPWHRMHELAGGDFQKTVLTVRVFQRSRFARIRENRVKDPRRACYHYLENQLARHHNGRLDPLVLKMEMGANAYRYLARQDFQEMFQRLNFYYPAAQNVKVILPGDDPYRPGDDCIPFTITLKDED